jgi:UDP:flavonoid glycosyltransferase YjiC (YdhE family)
VRPWRGSWASQALKASIPQAIVWHVGAMPVWDHKLVELGVAPQPRSHRQWLRRTIDRVLNDGEMRERARDVGCVGQREDDVGYAVRAIEETVGRATLENRSVSSAEFSL